MRERESHTDALLSRKNKETRRWAVGLPNGAYMGLSQTGGDLCRFGLRHIPWAKQQQSHGPRQLAGPLQQLHLITYTTYIRDVSMMIRVTEAIRKHQSLQQQGSDQSREISKRKETTIHDR